MSRRRFYAPPESIRDGAAVLPRDESRHLTRVLRLQPGDGAEVFDGTGRCYAGTVEGRGDSVRIVGLELLPAAEAGARPVTLALALLKSDKFDWVLQKGTELGISRFVPLVTAHCEPRIPEAKASARLERWNRIVREAAKQCRRCSLPAIEPPVGFSSFVTSPARSDDRKFLFHQRAGKAWKPADFPGVPLILCVGPEGGWDDAEVETAVQAGFEVCSLGPLVLRAETAAIAVAALVQLGSGTSII